MAKVYRWSLVSTPRWRRRFLACAPTTDAAFKQAAVRIKSVVKYAWLASVPAGSTTKTQRIGSGENPRLSHRHIPLSDHSVFFYCMPGMVNCGAGVFEALGQCYYCSVVRPHHPGGIASEGLLEMPQDAGG